MGGASSGAGTARKGGPALPNLPRDLHKSAAALGADVPFFLTGGAAIAEERGDHLTPIPVQPQWFAIAWPRVELPTPDVYRAWDEMPRTPGTQPNHLTEAAMSIQPRLQDFANALHSPPKNEWQMTGSGSAFFLRGAGEDEAEIAVSRLACWTAVAQAIGPRA